MADNKINIGLNLNLVNMPIVAALMDAIAPFYGAAFIADFYGNLEDAPDASIVVHRRDKDGSTTFELFASAIDVGGEDQLLTTRHLSELLAAMNAITEAVEAEKVALAARDQLAAILPTATVSIDRNEAFPREAMAHGEFVRDNFEAYRDPDGKASDEMQRVFDPADDPGNAP